LVGSGFNCALVLHGEQCSVETRRWTAVRESATNSRDRSVDLQTVIDQALLLRARHDNKFASVSNRKCASRLPGHSCMF
jgi:hypothetical protein